MTTERTSADDLRARVLAAAKNEPSPTRDDHRRRVVLVVAITVVAVALSFFAMGGFRAGSRPIEMIAFTSSFAMVAALAVGKVASPPRGSMLARPRAQLVTASVVAAPLLALVALAAAAAWPGPSSEIVSERVHLACGAMTFVQGVLPLLALFLTRRGTDPVAPAMTGAALGMTAGGWTAMMAYMRCPHAAATHCIVAHVGPTILLTGVGAVLGWLVLRPSAR
ncbi:MAG: DUF1109 family protein [Deltaproteobacteria bacterium]|nr:DUF1109 family protein [Deltaproteobacteria bacterium]